MQRTAFPQFPAMYNYVSKDFFSEYFTFVEISNVISFIPFWKTKIILNGNQYKMVTNNKFHVSNLNSAKMYRPYQIDWNLLESFKRCIKGNCYALLWILSFIKRYFVAVYLIFILNFFLYHLNIILEFSLTCTKFRVCFANNV